MARVIIVGDGPGGLTAALFLAKNGQDVQLFGGDETSWYTWRNCEFNEILGFYGLAYWYTWQVTILGLGPIWMSQNQAVKEKTAQLLREGGIFAFGLSEKEHGADLYSTETALFPAGAGTYRAQGSKYYIGNANAAAIAEHLFGVARQVQNFIAVFAGVGVGGGLFLNGKLYRGAYGFAGEIGHTSFMIESYRRPCRCGSRGCWETSVAQDSIIERMRARLAVGRNSIVSKLMAEQHSPLTLPLIIQAVNDGDTEAQEALIETGSLLGLGIASLISIFDPELIVLGGPLSMAGSYLVPPIKEAVENAVLPEIHGHVEITLSAFGADASVMGAAALVTEATLSNPGSVERLPVSAQLEASP